MLFRSQLCRPPRANIEVSSDGSLGSSDMDSDPVLTATSPHPADDAEVLSPEAPDRGETVPEAPQGDLPDSGSRGDGAPESSEFGPQPNTTPEPPAVPGSGRRLPSKRGKTPVPVTSVHPEVPDNLLEVLRNASIDEEHHTIMSAVIQKVQSAKSGLTEVCTSLLTGFKVSVLKCSRNITA